MKAQILTGSTSQFKALPHNEISEMIFTKLKSQSNHLIILCIQFLKINFNSKHAKTHDINSKFTNDRLKTKRKTKKILKILKKIYK